MEAATNIIDLNEQPSENNPVDHRAELQPQISEEGKKEIEIELLNLEESSSLNKEDQALNEPPAAASTIEEGNNIQLQYTPQLLLNEESEEGSRNEMINFEEEDTRANNAGALLEAPTEMGDIEREVPASPPPISEERRKELEDELFSLEDDVATLKQVLLRKEKQLNDYKAELGHTTWTRIQNSEALKQSKQVLSEAGVKTGQAFKHFGYATASKWSELKQSEKVQSMTEKFWSATGAMKSEINCKLGWGGPASSTSSKSPPPFPTTPSPNCYSPNLGEAAFNNMGMMMCAQVNTISDESDNEERVVVSNTDVTMTS